MLCQYRTRLIWMRTQQAHPPSFDLTKAAATTGPRWFTCPAGPRCRLVQALGAPAVACRAPNPGDRQRQAPLDGPWPQIVTE